MLLEIPCQLYSHAGYIAFAVSFERHFWNKVEDLPEALPGVSKLFWGHSHPPTFHKVSAFILFANEAG